jgi:hypothetical protein
VDFYSRAAQTFPSPYLSTNHNVITDPFDIPRYNYFLRKAISAVIFGSWLDVWWCFRVAAVSGAPHGSSRMRGRDELAALLWMETWGDGEMGEI